ncbi:MAG: DUF2723 domain-containing protein [Ardenticatenaceae bacterium]|nr:DUF2723 domain-containing protein [Ardenticatenaceae bacterium]MCB9444193.1 DUF2723 domain-containing protein [Ardenticatenaceae bacterium]
METKNVNLQFLISSLLIIIPILYLSTLAQTLVLGDPTEYTFIANILGIAHPPGYAFITLMGKLFQTLIPFGDVPWRMHVLSATSATLAVFFVFGTVRNLTGLVPTINKEAERSKNLSGLAALFAALVVGTAVNFWQHAIHANPHIITATFLAANLYFLTKWVSEDEGVKGCRGEGVRESAITPSPVHPFTRSRKWLYAFALSAGLGVTHHPLTVFGFPAYVLFIVWIRPSILKDWRTLLKMVGFALLGLSVWLYYPLRSPSAPFGPTSMNTLNGFLDHVLARGLSESLPYFGLADQWDRLIVFWSILRLQYSLPVILLAVWGIIWPFLKKTHSFTPSPAYRVNTSPRHLVTLYLLTFASFYAFVISLRAQDIMAYILGPVLIVGLFSGIGLVGLIEIFNRRDAENAEIDYSLRPLRLRGLFVLLFFAVGPIWQIVHNFPLVSLRDYDEGQAYVDAVFADFAGTNEGATLLNDWEHMTPLWYTKFVQDRWPDPADVRPEFVSAAKPWVEFVFDYLGGGPVYLSNYRRDVVDAGFRLRPFPPFYQVVEPGDTSIPSELTAVPPTGDVIQVVGYGWEGTATSASSVQAVTAGDYVPLTLAMRTPTGTADYYVPVLHVGQMEFAFTTDSHLTTPNWLPGEIIVEQFDFALPHNLAGGSYPVTLDLKNLSADEVIELNLSLGELTVTGLDKPIQTDHLLANFRQRVGLVSAVARENGRYNAPWPNPIPVQPGDIINLTLKWEALDYAEESYTVFVHLIDLANQPIVTLDYTPLGGSMPTHLWFPKWLPGQQMLDPYRLQIPPDLPPGTYLIEVGLYEMVGKRRLHISDVNGNLVGDRYILGAVIVGGD